jgi:hypothetical protein
MGPLRVHGSGTSARIIILLSRTVYSVLLPFQSRLPYGRVMISR